MAGDSHLGSMGASSSLVVVDPPHIARFKGIVAQLRYFIENSAEARGLGKMAFLMTTLADELAEEMKDMDEMQIRIFMFQIGEVISWIGHGENERLPDVIRPFAENIQPTREHAASANTIAGTNTATG
jgi:hypothetical protein